MAKTFIVRLRTGSPTGPIVANSQIITVNGVGSGAIIASDFTDNALTGSVQINSEKIGYFTKQIFCPTTTTTTTTSTTTTTTSTTTTTTTTAPTTTTTTLGQVNLTSLTMNYNYTKTVDGSNTRIELIFYDDGTYAVVAREPNTILTEGNWFSPTIAGIGNNHYVRFAVNQQGITGTGSITATPSAGSFGVIDQPRIFTVAAGTGVGGAIANVSITISNSITGTPVLGTARITLGANNTPTTTTTTTTTQYIPPNIPLPFPSLNVAVDETGNNLVQNATQAWYRFTLTSPATVRIDTEGSNPLLDPMVALFVSSGTIFAGDDDSGTGDNAQLTRYLTPGTYYVVVSHFVTQYSGLGNGTNFKVTHTSGIRIGTGLVLNIRQM